MPRWVTVKSMNIMCTYFKNGNVEFLKKIKNLPDQTIQRLLWLSDFFQINDFQIMCLLKIIIPRLNYQNCIIYLNEAFKKLKACESSNDMWYLLLNNSMNFVAKNLYWLIQNKSQKLMKHINTRIGEEILIRSYKYSLKI